MAHVDGQLDQELEQGILYLEQLLDKRRAEDLLRLAKDLAGRRRDLAGLLEKYRAAPSARRRRSSSQDLADEGAGEGPARADGRAVEGFNDEHMNEEALAEMANSQDLAGGLDEVEKKLAAGRRRGRDEGVDQMASAMDKMLAGLQRTAGRPTRRRRRS